MDPENRWLPERFFYSHATSDDRLTAIVKDVLESVPGHYEVYVAERGLVGRPLMDKLRDEMMNCNAVLVGWTTSASSRSSEIISFELGMAFSLGLPIYILRHGQLEMPWFFPNLTDYAVFAQIVEDDVQKALSTLVPRSFYHPLDVVFPAAEEPAKLQSMNPHVVRGDGSIELPVNFDGIVHFNVINRRQHSERDVRMTLTFPDSVAVQFDPGTRDGASGVQRNEMFDMWEAPPGCVRLYWPSLPLDSVSFELHLIVKKGYSSTSDNVELRASSDNMVGWRRKIIPLCIGS